MFLTALLILLICKLRYESFGTAHNQHGICSAAKHSSYPFVHSTLMPQKYRISPKMDNWKWKIRRNAASKKYGFLQGRTPGQRKFENSLGTPIAGSDKVWGNQEMVSPLDISYTRALLGHRRWNGSSRRKICETDEI